MSTYVDAGHRRIIILSCISYNPPAAHLTMFPQSCLGPVMSNYCKEREKKLPVVGHRQGNLKLGQKLEILFLCLLCEPCSYQKHLHNRYHNRYDFKTPVSTHKTTERQVSPWGLQFGSLHFLLYIERIWGVRSSPSIPTATRDIGSRECKAHGWCQESGARFQFLSRNRSLVVGKKGEKERNNEEITHRCGDASQISSI